MNGTLGPELRADAPKHLWRTEPDLFDSSALTGLTEGAAIPLKSRDGLAMAGIEAPLAAPVP